MEKKHFENNSTTDKILAEALDWDGVEKIKGCTNTNYTQQLPHLDTGINEESEYEQNKINEISNKRYRLFLHQ